MEYREITSIQLFKQQTIDEKLLPQLFPMDM